MENLENKNYKILMIDDEEIILMMYQMQFKKIGYEINTVLSAEEALKKMKTENFDVFVVDLNLGDKMHGFDFIEKLRNENLIDENKTVVAVLSNQKEDEDIKKAEKLKIDEYLRKLDPPEHNLEKITKSINQKLN
jgi:CheY-like chemotaxis protein